MRTPQEARDRKVTTFAWLQEALASIATGDPETTPAIVASAAAEYMEAACDWDEVIRADAHVCSCIWCDEQTCTPIGDGWVGSRSTRMVCPACAARGLA